MTCQTRCDMEEIIAPVDRKLIIGELTEGLFLRNTSKLQNQLYLVNAHNAPNIMQEIGRLRELSFRTAGGGTGKCADIDSYDTSAKPFEQLILWDPEDQEIIAGYRVLLCKNAPRDEQGHIISATTNLFTLSEQFVLDYLPDTIELGRSFVQPKYQRGASKKGLFSMDNLWDGLGAVIVLNPGIKYLFGKVTMYPSYHREGRNMLLSFMQHYFPDEEQLVRPIKPYVFPEDLAPYQGKFDGMGYKEGHTLLNREIRQRGENIPPLINSYMGISGTMKTFGTALNSHFGDVEETGIMVTIADIYETKRDRYLNSYHDNKEFRGPLGL